MRSPQDTVPQRQLVYQLALAIDTCILAQRKGHAMSRSLYDLNRIIEANPRSSFSTHVLHNIGARRSRWLLAARAAGALPVRSDTRSSSAH